MFSLMTGTCAPKMGLINWELLDVGDPLEIGEKVNQHEKLLHNLLFLLILEPSYNQVHV